MATVTCARCARLRQSPGRGLCHTCYDHARRHGLREDYPRTRRSRDEVLADWQLLADWGLDRGAAAARIGITRRALNHHISKENKETA